MVVGAGQFGGQAFGIVAVLESTHLERKIAVGKVHRYQVLLSVRFLHAAGRGRQDHDFHRRRSGAHHAQFLGGPVGQVDNAIFHEGAAVVDAHIQLLVVAQIVHPHHGAEGQGFVGGRNAVHVVYFAI